MRFGPYIEGGVRPIKLRLKTQTATEEILVRTYQLRDTKEYKDVFIKKSMNEKETKFLRIKGKHEAIVEDTLESLEKIIESSQRVIHVGTFNCSEVKWKMF